jgi:predicted anti-sigma-YlaC factor YlaD
MFDLLLDGDLTEQEESSITKHLAECSACRFEFEREKEIIARLEQLPELPCPEELLQGIREAVIREERSAVTSREKRSRFLLFRWKLVPVGLAVAIVILYLIREPSTEHRGPIQVAYSTQEVELARTRVMWSLIFVGRKVNSVEKKAIEVAFFDNLPSALKKGAKVTEPLLQGGRK